MTQKSLLLLHLQANIFLFGEISKCQKMVYIISNIYDAVANTIESLN